MTSETSTKRELSRIQLSRFITDCNGLHRVQVEVDKKVNNKKKHYQSGIESKRGHITAYRCYNVTLLRKHKQTSMFSLMHLLF